MLAVIMNGKEGCPACLGEGGWNDPVAECPIVCYLCHPEAYKKQAFAYRQATGRPATWLRGFPKVQAKHYGPRFVATPWLFVLHTGVSNENVAQFMRIHGAHTRERDGRKILVSAHFTWDNELGNIVQSVPLNRVGWHVGGARIESERLRNVWPEAPEARLRKLNFCSYGMELRGPPGRRFTVGERNRVRDCVMRLRRINPQLRVATRHMDIQPTKKDPGGQFDMDIFRECGMVVYG